MQPLPNQTRAITLYGAIALLWCQFAMAQSSNRQQTFGFRVFEATVLSPYQMIHISQENASFVRTQVQKELESYGLTHVSSPDIYVDIFIHLKLENQTTSGYSGGFSEGGYTKGYSIYEVGTLIIKLNDAADDRLVWQGSRTVPLWKKKEKRIRKKVHQVITKILRRFDPEVLG